MVLFTDNKVDMGLGFLITYILLVGSTLSIIIGAIWFIRNSLNESRK